jgi:hypothetical protein
MRKTLFWGLFILFISIGCSAGKQPQGQDNLRVEVKEEALDSYAWDFGQVKEGQVLKHVFTFKNESTKTLKIKDINTSCGCTVSQAKKMVLLPQETTTIEVKFDSKGYSGPVKQYVYVHTDDLDNPVIRFIIKAQVVK